MTMIDNIDSNDWDFRMADDPDADDITDNQGEGDEEKPPEIKLDDDGDPIEPESKEGEETPEGGETPKWTDADLRDIAGNPDAMREILSQDTGAQALNELAAGLVEEGMATKTAHDDQVREQLAEVTTITEAHARARETGAKEDWDKFDKLNGMRTARLEASKEAVKEAGVASTAEFKKVIQMTYAKELGNLNTEEVRQLQPSNFDTPESHKATILSYLQLKRDEEAGVTREQGDAQENAKVGATARALGAGSVPEGTAEESNAGDDIGTLLRRGMGFDDKEGFSFDDSD